MAHSWFPQWRKREGNLDGAVIAPDERLRKTLATLKPWRG